MNLNLPWICQEMLEIFGGLHPVIEIAEQSAENKTQGVSFGSTPAHKPSLCRKLLWVTASVNVQVLNFLRHS